MARDEPDRNKRAKLDALQLSDDEWERVQLFLSLLGVSHPRNLIYTRNNIFKSMLKLHSKPFLLTMGQLCI
jgi:hypothetical protein